MSLQFFIISVLFCSAYEKRPENEEETVSVYNIVRFRGVNYFFVCFRFDCTFAYLSAGRARMEENFARKNKSDDVTVDLCGCN